MKKECSRCLLEKPLAAFYRRARAKDGFRSECKICTNNANRSYALSHPEVVALASKNWVSRHPEKRKIIKTAWASKNPESIKRSNARQYEKRRALRPPLVRKEKKKPDWKYEYQKNREQNLQKQAAWRERNREALRERYRLYSKLHKAKCREKFQRYRAKKYSAVPRWANIAAMREIYSTAAWLTKTTGVKHHVDHVIPLNSPMVQGFHCESNLEILTAYKNISKSNRTWPDMP